MKGPPMIRLLLIACLMLLFLAAPVSADTDRSIPGKSKPHDAATRSERVSEHTQRQHEGSHRKMTPKSKAHDAATRSERVAEHTKKQRDPAARKLPRR